MCSFIRSHRAIDRELLSGTLKLARTRELIVYALYHHPGAPLVRARSRNRFSFPAPLLELLRSESGNISDPHGAMFVASIERALIVMCKVSMWFSLCNE